MFHTFGDIRLRLAASAHPPRQQHRRGLDLVNPGLREMLFEHRHEYRLEYYERFFAFRWTLDGRNAIPRTVKGMLVYKAAVCLLVIKLLFGDEAVVIAGIALIRPGLARRPRGCGLHDA